MPRRIIIVIGALAVLAGMCVVTTLAIQAIPFGRTHSNPPVVSEPNWPDPAVRDLAVRACFDCHSNQTKWPWYADVAPMSWVVELDVLRGRRAMNFSDWGSKPRSAEQMVRLLQEGEMPPFTYRITHPGAQLTAAEKAQLAQGLAGLR